ncbi:hypothetical protein QR680_013413 [Steinernema hermaphroditum]|uniref:ATP synthase subunit epsilon, mitochondrial n=1 Tax=Steinernema hermaphroditum TaxID=289476 RepID=A0AA39M2G7_9BILA|nr:hypothetical protein QR680_013413 [Steinernema hermaphroditum]
MQWRTAGLNYVRYSQIAAQVVRQCLKDSKSATPKKSPASIKITPWQKGEPVKKEHGLALANDGDVDEETWLCDVADEPTIPSSADRGNQSSNELIEWLQGSTESIDYRTRSALSRRVRNHANKKKLAPEEDDEDEFFDAREDFSDSSFGSPRVPGNTLNEIDEITPIASPVPPLEVGVAQMITPRRSNVTIIRPKADVFHATPSPSSHLVTPHQAPKPNVNVKLRSNSRPPTAVVAPSKKAMTEPPRPATSLARRVPTTSMSSSFSQSNSRENSFQLSGGLMGDLYRSQLEKATKFEDIENIAKMQEQELLKQLEFGVRERKSSFQSDTPSRPEAPCVETKEWNSATFY